MKWNVGPEHESSIFPKLGKALRNLGFNLTDNWEGVAGSQEVNHWEVASPDGELIIEAETFIGLTVEGPSNLVEQVRNAFDALED